jgi:NADP-dependent 3-hydroxy acid dehydrogenase YdfG
LNPTPALQLSGRNSLAGFAMTLDARAVLHQQTALVTGASSGIGAATAIALARAGAKVGVNYRGSREGAEEVIGAISDLGGNAVALEADVSNESESSEHVCAFHRSIRPDRHIGCECGTTAGCPC